MAIELDPLKLSSPRIFLFRMLLFVALFGVIVFLLHKQIEIAFMANPALNALIILVLTVGAVLAFRQVLRLYPEIGWVNQFRRADPGLAVKRPPVLLAPMAAILGSRMGRMAISAQMLRGILEFDRHPPRRSARHLALHDGFAGVPRAPRHVLGPDPDGGLGRRRHPGAQGDRRRRVDVQRLARGSRRPAQRHGYLVLVVTVRACRIAGAWISRSAVEPGANRFYTELEDWLSTTVYDQAGEPAMAGAGEMRNAIERLRTAVNEAGGNKAATAVLANLAEAIQGLVNQMRAEQQTIRDWVEGQAEQQAEQHGEIKRLLEMIVREDVNS